MFVLHLNWSHGSLRVWGEHSQRFITARDTAIATGTHPYAATIAELRAALAPALEHARTASGDDARIAAEGSLTDSSLMLLLPHSDTAIGQLPLPSDRLSACDEVAGFSAEPEETLAPIEVPAVALDPRTAFALLRVLDTESTDDTVAWGHDARWWNAVSQFTQHLINDQRVIPTVVQERNGSMFAAWRPWLQDAPNHSKFTALVRGAPALVRAAEGAGAATTLLEQSMGPGPRPACRLAHRTLERRSCGAPAFRCGFKHCAHGSAMDCQPGRHRRGPRDAPAPATSGAASRTVSRARWSRR